MITLADHQKLQTEVAELTAQLEELRKVNVEDIRSTYESQLVALNQEIEALKSEETIQSSEVFKSIAQENEANKAKISELEESITVLQVDKEKNDEVVNTMVQEKLASVGVAPIKALTENKVEAKKSSYATADEYFASIK
jgi:hypothetical protein